MPVQATTLPLPTARYSEDIVTAIRGKAGQSKLGVAKLLALVEELNDNYAPKNTDIGCPCAPAGNLGPHPADPRLRWLSSGSEQLHPESDGHAIHEEATRLPGPGR